MTLEIRDAIRRHDRMRTGTVAFHNAKRQVANMMRYASARFVERDFDPGLPQRVLWSNLHRLRLGFCNSSDFYFLGVGVEEFAELLRECSCFFCPDIPTALEDLVDFRFVILISSSPLLFFLWKVTIIRPVANVGTPSGPSDFHSISVVSVLTHSP
jgi:hypothetical protein